MQVIPAKHIGFCFGVKRAISLAREAASQGTVYTYGALIHNGDVIARLISNGLLKKEGSSLALTEWGMDVSNFVLSEFLLG